MPAPQKSTRKNMFKDININFRVNSIFWKKTKFFRNLPKKFWEALNHFLQKLQFSGSVFIIKILIINLLDVII